MSTRPSAACSAKRSNRNELTEFVLDFFQKELTLRFIVPEAEESGDETGEIPAKKAAADSGTIRWPYDGGNLQRPGWRCHE